MKTLWMVGLSGCLMTGQDFVPLTNSTLNEVYGVGKSFSTTTPHIQYFGLGLDLLEEQEATGVASLNRFKHSPLDVNVKYPVPLRLVEEPLNDTEAALYRIKVPLILDGVNYIGYYIKKATHVDGRYMALQVKGAEVRTDTLQNVVTVPTQSLADDKIHIDDVNFVAFNVPFKIEITPLEMEDIRKAADLIYKNPNCNIGEVMLISGVDEIVDGELEATCAQVCFFEEMRLDINSTSGFRLLEVGGLEWLKDIGL